MTTARAARNAFRGKWKSVCKSVGVFSMFLKRFVLFCDRFSRLLYYHFVILLYLLLLWLLYSLYLLFLAFLFACFDFLFTWFLFCSTILFVFIPLHHQDDWRKSHYVVGCAWFCSSVCLSWCHETAAMLTKYLYQLITV